MAKTTACAPAAFGRNERLTVLDVSPGLNVTCGAAGVKSVPPRISPATALTATFTAEADGRSSVKVTAAVPPEASVCDAVAKLMPMPEEASAPPPQPVPPGR